MELTAQEIKKQQEIKEKIEEKAEESGDDQKEDAKQGVEGDQQKKKKKKKKNKKKKKEGDTEIQTTLQSEVAKNIPKGAQQAFPQTQTNQIFRCLGGWKTPIKIKFPNNQFQGYGENEIHQYKVPRVKTEQLKAKQLLLDEQVQYLRKAAEIQKQVRRFAQTIIKPGRRLIDICEELENYNRKLAPQKGLQSGIAFPTGCSLNHVAAHYTPNTGDDTVLQYDDVCKIDFGTHIKGRIIDCAFTVAFNPTYDRLLEAVKEATYTGIKEAGIDARLGEIGQKIQQTMESYEVQIKGRVYPVKVVKNLNGHSIDPYKIHAGKTVPCVKTNSNVKMEEGQQYAIETFGSTGKGFVREDGQCSHYMKDFYIPANAKIPARSKAFFNLISEKYSTLAFARRWIDKLDFPSYILPLRDLVQAGFVNPYPPLCDNSGSYVAQWEHTLILRPTCKEILSKSQDF